WGGGCGAGAAGRGAEPHHPPRAGAPPPAAPHPPGYRRYTDADLARLQQILFYRELGFPLDEIAVILRDPQADALHHLRERQRRLREEIARLERLAEVAEQAIEVQRTGVTLTPEERFEVFGEISFDLSYATEAQLRWQDSAAYREAMTRAAGHTTEDWRRLMTEAAAWRAELLAAFDADEPADGERAMDLAEQHRRHLARWFTPCPPDTHRRIADDLAADPRAFALLVPPSQQRPGLAAYVSKAIHANASRRDGSRTDPGEHP
ncbi:MerR family transcriptional regulator, partial [Streptomyces tricolor]